MSVTAVPLRPIKKGSLVKLWVALGALGLIGAGVAYAQTSDPSASFLSSNGHKAGVITTPSGLQYQVIKQGNGPSPTLSDVAVINYVGRLTDGSTFDANDGVPMPVSGVVPGFSEALQLMKTGGKYRLWIPPKLGYGSEEKRDQTGKVVIPANSILVFDVDLLSTMPLAQFEAMMQQQQMQQQQQMPGQGGER